MDTITLVVIGIIFIALLLVVAKFFFRLLKHIIIATILGVGFMVFWYYGSQPRPNPNIGKQAYQARTGEYLGVVEGEAVDASRGPVWIIKPPNNQPNTSYRKANVTLKEKP